MCHKYADLTNLKTSYTTNLQSSSFELEFFAALIIRFKDYNMRNSIISVGQNLRAIIIQCVTIENRQSPFYVINRVTLAGKKLYQKSCWASELTICMLRGFRSFQKGTLGLCRSTGCKVTSCQSWRMILSSENRTWAALEMGRLAEFFSNLQL